LLPNFIEHQFVDNKEILIVNEIFRLTFYNDVIFIEHKLILLFGLWEKLDEINWGENEYKHLIVFALFWLLMILFLIWSELIILILIVQAGVVLYFKLASLIECVH